MNMPDEIDGIAALKINIRYEKEIVKEELLFLKQIETLDILAKKIRVGKQEEEKNLLLNTLNSLLLQLKIVNNSIPEIAKKISVFKELPYKAEKKERREETLISLKFKPYTEKESFIAIKKSDKLRFLRELVLAEESIKRLKKEYRMPREGIEEFKKPSTYAKISNKLFLKLSTKLIDKGYFGKTSGELRKANLYLLLPTYISMAFFTTLIAFFVSIFMLIVLLFFNLSFEYPFLLQAEESVFLRFLKNFWLFIALPLLTFVSFYFYPSLEKKSIASKINHELPFVAIHMSAIAGSGVEPTKIFKVIVMSREYPYTKKEIKKLLNEINVYGYDLVSALGNIARVTSSNKLAELFRGLATTITSGGDLKEFLDKRAETLVFDFRLEREKYNRMAETFMDIYISVVIAAPMIMTILLVIINLTGMSFGLSIGILTLLILLIISLINIFFLVFLHLRQVGAE